ncbi:MAG: hypothetical protein AAFR58_25805 [Cyanobacteria bacterium J06627_28]
MKRFPKDVVAQAARIQADLESGAHWSQIGGRRHTHSDRVVFDLKHWYRLVCWHPCQAPLRLEMMTHERYNRVARNARR